MTHKIKVLGLALIAIFAMSAVVASAASAQNGVFTTGGAARTLVGTQTGEEKANSLTAFGVITLCPTATYTGHKSNVTPHESLPNGSTSVTITPSYGTCTVSGTPFVEVVDMNGCDYAFDLLGTTGVADEYNLTTTINCPAGKHIVLTMATNEAEHKTGTYFCNFTITEKTEYPGLKARDTTNNSIDITGTIEGITVHKAANPSHPGILCPSETTNTGIFHFDVTLRDKNGGAIGISHL